MKIIDNLLYIEFSDFINAGWKEDAIKKANFRNGPFWQMLPDPLDKRKTLVQYDTLRPKDKERITTQFGNPYEYVAKEPIRKMVQLDPAAELFFKDHRYDEDKYLPFEHQVKYTTAASWLNLLIKLNENKRIIKKDLNLSLEKFWSNVCDIIKADNIDLPTSYRRLLNKMDEYKESGYAVLIDWRFGNKLSAKIGKTDVGFNEEVYNKQISLIRNAATRANNFDAQQITSAVNMIFEKNNWPTVSLTTVYNICKENSHLTMPGRRGKREYNNHISMQHLRKRPEFPLHYLTLDGWTVELLYQEDKTYNNRLVVVIVLDVMNNYPIGYAIGDRENTELIRMANRNASLHIHQLFGDYYQPKQLQSDNYGIANLTPFYQAMAHLHTPAAVGNAKSKVIEPYFKYLNKTYCQRFPNWSGFNITSKKDNQPNTEYLNMIKRSFPTKEEVIAQIEMFINQERKTKIDQYMQGWQALPDHEKVTMNIMDRIMVFGKPTNYTNTITGMGLNVTIGGQKLVYDSFDPAFRSLQHLKWQVVYDECDLSSILVINEESKRRFVLDSKRALPMDIHSMNAEDHEYRSRITNFNKQRYEEIMQTYIGDNEAVAEIMNNTPLNLNDFDEASLKLMFTTGGQQKEALQDAKGLKKIEHVQQKQIAKDEKIANTNWMQQQQEYLMKKNDFNQYLD